MLHSGRVRGDTDSRTGSRRACAFRLRLCVSGWCRQNRRRGELAIVRARDDDRAAAEHAKGHAGALDGRRDGRQAAFADPCDGSGRRSHQDARLAGERGARLEVLRFVDKFGLGNSMVSPSVPLVHGPGRRRRRAV